MKLYHGTSARHLVDILKSGLRPRGNSPSVWDAHPSIRSHVYLTTAYPLFFAMNASEPTDDYLVVEVESDRLLAERFYPDEDCVAQALLQSKAKEPGKNLVTLDDYTAHARDEIERFRSAWQVSLESLGNCSYRGEIPPDAITRVATISQKRTDVLTDALQPSITPMNYRLCGKMYREMVEWLFGDIDEWETQVTRFAGPEMNPDLERFVTYHRNRCQNRDGIKVTTLIDLPRR